MTSAPTPPSRRLAARFAHFAEVECPETPLYQAVCRIVASEPALLALLDATPDAQQRPTLWLAAVHERLLAGERHALADYYDSVGGRRPPDAALADCLRDFAARHGPALRERMRTATTQTNEVGRCAVLWPALHAAAARAGRRRLALLDFGCSAGLNLGVDVYAAERLPDGSPLLACEDLGPAGPDTAGGLEIVHRLGIDPAPVDLGDDAAVRWLHACLWPGDPRRAARLQRAVALARERRWPVQAQADCTGFVAGWLATLPPDVQPVVFNSWVLAYFEPAALARHLQVMHELIRRTGVMWLSAEGAKTPIGGPPPPAAPPGPANATVWTLAWRRGGELAFDVLARSHAHGRWRQWLAPGEGG